MNFVFGPIYSRRLGLSLGIDLLGKKICSFNCVYCEIAKTEIRTVERKSYVSIDLVLKELEEFFTSYKGIKIDYISISGRGEPTLHKDLGRIIKEIKTKYPEYKLAVFTNSAHLDDIEVRRNLFEADLILPSLNAVSPRVYRNINLHDPSISVERVIKGIFSLKKEFKGLIYLEILFVKNLNDKQEEILLLKDFVRKLQPDAVYINSIFRPPAFKRFQGISKEEQSLLQKDFDSLIKDLKNFQEFPKENSSQKDLSSQEKQGIRKVLKRILTVRPSKEEDIRIILETYSYKWDDENKWKEFFKDLLKSKIIIALKEDQENFTYYRYNTLKIKEDF